MSRKPADLPSLRWKTGRRPQPAQWVEGMRPEPRGAAPARGCARFSRANRVECRAFFEVPYMSHRERTAWLCAQSYANRSRPACPPVIPCYLYFFRDEDLCLGPLGGCTLRIYRRILPMTSDARGLGKSHRISVSAAFNRVSMIRYQGKFCPE